MFAKCHMFFPNEATCFKMMLEAQSYQFCGLWAHSTHFMRAIEAKREILAEIQLGMF